MASGSSSPMPFQSTLPARGATARPVTQAGLPAFQSTLPARGATTSSPPLRTTFVFQSTLPARGATCRRIPAPTRRRYFNPRSPHGERLVVIAGVLAQVVFQSTLPARGATRRMRQERKEHSLFQSTLPARGATARGSTPESGKSPFQSTLPARGATPQFGKHRQLERISIHAPRTGSDSARNQRTPTGADFNPRSPHGERRVHAHRGAGRRGDFNPRSPHGERQVLRLRQHLRHRISIHAPRTGSDIQRFC